MNRIELWPIDFDKTIKDISEWHDRWRVMRFGSDSLNPERYYNITEDGRYLYGEKEGVSINDEKAICERVLELLLRIRMINGKINGKGLSQHLLYTEREQLKKEREGFYNEFLDIVQQPKNHEQEFRIASNRIELKKERWLDIDGYENYQVSDFGRVRSKERTVIQLGHKSLYERTLKSHLLKQRKQNGGYLIVWLCENGISKAVTVHRLVASAFLGMSDKDVNHKDGNKENNHIDNLEYVSRSENIQHAYRKLNRKRNTKSVMCIETGEVFSSIRSAAKAKGINNVSIGHVLAGRNKTAGGFTWKSV